MQARRLQRSARSIYAGVITVREESVENAQQAAKVLSVLKHVRENNVSYLLGVFVLHSMGFLEQAVTYGSGMC